MDLYRRRQHYSTFTTLLTLFSCLDESWIRKRVWGSMQTLVGVFVMMTPGRASSYQAVCATVFDWAGARFCWGRTPDPAGFQRARLALTEVECLRVFALAKTWATKHLAKVQDAIPGRQVVAVDGTILHVPRSRGLVKNFGLAKNYVEYGRCHYPQALLVSAWDVARRLPLAWTLSSIKHGEREVLEELLTRLPEACVLLLDRGYPARDLLGKILASGRDVVMRMVAADKASWPEVAAFIASGKRDAVVHVIVGLGTQRRSIRMRFVLRTFNAGRPQRHQQRNTMVIATSLTDSCITTRDVCRLYGQRWGIETIYREMKAVAQIEHWHGTTKALIQQEIIALMLWFTITAVLAGRSETKTSTERQSLRINTRRAFDAISYILESLFIASSSTGETAEKFLARANEALRRLDAWKQARRPGRSYSRVPKHPYARSKGK